MKSSTDMAHLVNKWEYNIPEDVVPMWVADMDFAAAPEIREAMQKRLDHPVYGYTHHSKELKDAIVSLGKEDVITGIFRANG